jgi:glycosidase
MNLQAVFHETKSKYAYAFDADTLHIRIRTEKNDVESVTLIGGDPFQWVQSESDPTHWEWDHQSAFNLPMQLEYQTDLFDYWFILVKPLWKRIRYGFILKKDTQEILYGSRDFYDLKENPQFRYEVSFYFNFPYINHEDVYLAPEWVKDTIWYQIFPERFADGDSSNNPMETKSWGDDGKESTSTFFGGDLQGVIDRLDYLQNLGINGIYFTPIFSSPSSHKYDTTNYYEIDPAFGTNELFKKLIGEAHTRGIKIMLDAVFNHCGWFHPFWQDVVNNGKQSKYYDCFFIDREPVINFEINEGKLPKLSSKHMGNLNYRTFAFAPYMPKWNTDHPLVKEHLFGSIKYWTEQFGVDGWRLDVSNEVSHDFWREFRHLVHQINPEVYILGENWDNSTPWLQGDQFDGVMNYELTYPIWNLLGFENRVTQHLDVHGYQNEINKLLVAYPKHTLPNMYNLIDSHDTPRIDFKCGGNKEKIKLAYALMMTFSGSPSIYYGSEVGLPGPTGHNRRCMLWNEKDQDLELFAHVKQLIQLRKMHSSFKSVDIKWLDVNSSENTFIMKKESEDEFLFFLVNINESEKTLQLPKEVEDKVVIDLMQEQSIHLQIYLKLSAFGFRLLVIKK